MYYLFRPIDRLFLQSWSKINFADRVSGPFLVTILNEVLFLGSFIVNVMF